MASFLNTGSSFFREKRKENLTFLNFIYLANYIASIKMHRGEIFNRGNLLNVAFDPRMGGEVGEECLL